MDGSDPLLDRVRAALRAYDDEALAALGNRGLVRRARKDLERARPGLIGEVEGRLRLSVEDSTVEVREAIRDASCTCPAGGICRHILGALIFLKESGGPAAPASMESIGPELLAVDDAALEKWAGKAMVRRAHEVLGRGLEVEFEDAIPFVLRIPTLNIACRWMPGGGLEGMVCSCHAREPCEHRVLAVLGYQVARGKRRVDIVKAGLGEAEGAPRTREEVLASVGAVLTEMVTLGLSRLSLSVQERLRTLAVSAHGVDLPRLERLLRALADEARWMLARDARASASSLVAVAAHVEALRRALANPKPALIGQHRTVYDRVGDIQLAGMGARRWRTKSGYVGLTVYFWDRSRKDWATWSESRPETAGGFSPQGRYGDVGPWPGCESPSLASRSVVRLAGAWRNSRGRLSGRPSTHAIPSGPSDPMEVAAVSRWSELGERAFRLFGGGLQERRENQDLLVLAPASWEPARFDAVRQESERVVRDAGGRPLPLVLQHTPETAEAITLLERADGAGIRGLLAALRLREGRLIAEPIALYEKDRIVNLTLDASPPAAAPLSTPDAAVEEEEPEESIEAGHSASVLGVALTALEGQLEAIAEGGLAAYRGLDELIRLRDRIDALGLGACSRAAGRLIEQLGTLRRGGGSLPDAARAVLETCHVVRLASDAESVAGAVGSLT